MALNLRYTDENGILHINMSPTSPRTDAGAPAHPADTPEDPIFDTINNRFGAYDLFNGKYDVDSGDEQKSLFRSRYNSIETELANTPYAFTSDRSNRSIFDIEINSRADTSPSKDIEDDRFFRNLDTDNDIFGPSIDFHIKSSEDSPAFTVTQLIHAQDRYFDLSSRQNETSDGRVKSLTKKFEVKSAPGSAKRTVKIVKSEDVKEEAFQVLSADKPAKSVKVLDREATLPVVPTSKRRREQSFVIIGETPSRPTSPHSLPIDYRTRNVSPFKGKGFRETSSSHTTPRTSAANSRTNSPHRRRTSSLSRIDKMAPVVSTIPLAHRPHSPRNFVKENIEEVRELSEINREKHEAEAEKRRKEEEEALIKEIDEFEKGTSRSASRASSPTKRLRSRSNSPSVGVNMTKSTEELATRPNHASAIRATSRTRTQSNKEPQNSKIPKRQNSLSPVQAALRRNETGLSKNQKFISKSTSSISTIPFSKSKPPISPGRAGPPPSNRAINPKRLSPIVGTPNKSPIDDNEPTLAAKPKSSSYKPAKPINASSKVNNRSITSRDPSPDKRKTMTSTTLPKTLNRSNSTTLPKTLKNNTNTTLPKTLNHNTSTTLPKTLNKSTNKTLNQRSPPKVAPKPEAKIPVSRTNSVKNLSRVPSTKNLNERPGSLNKNNKQKDGTETQIHSKNNDEAAKNAKEDKQSTKQTREVSKTDLKDGESKSKPNNETTNSTVEQVTMLDNETQYDQMTNDKGELVIMTKKNVISMTTAAIASQPLDVVTTVTNQLPAALEKAREKGIFERHSSKDSLAPRNDDRAETETSDKKPKPKSIVTDNNVKIKPLQPPYNNPQVERVKQKIDDILKAPEVSTENILATATNEAKEYKSTLRTIAEKTSTDIKQRKDEAADKLTEIKDQAVKQNAKVTDDIKSEATKIVNSIITPVEETVREVKDEIKKNIEPIVMVVNEKSNGKTSDAETTEKLVKGNEDIEVQSSNLSTPRKEMMQGKGAEEISDKSSHSNGGLPQSTSTTPKPPPRDKQNKTSSNNESSKLATPEHGEEKKENICKRFFTNCAGKSKLCACCARPKVAKPEKVIENIQDGVEKAAKKSVFSKLNCCKKTAKEHEVKEQMVKEIKKDSRKASITFEEEVPRSKWRRLCCRGRRVADVPGLQPVEEPTGCCGRKRRVEDRRDSILSDRPPAGCWSGVCVCVRGAAPAPPRRASIFSKNKSLSPTLPPEDTRPKLDPSLVEHTSRMRAAIPALPAAAAALCLALNVLAPGLGTVLSGVFCLCFGVPRFGIHDGAKHRIGSFVINLLVGVAQLFTVMFCLVGWGWAVWWGVIMLRVARKYKKLKQEAAAAEAGEQPPVINENHTQA